MQPVHNAAKHAYEKIQHELAACMYTHTNVTMKFPRVVFHAGPRHPRPVGLSAPGGGRQR